MRWIAPLIAVCACSCAQPPTREIELATARIDRARTDGAAVFAPDLLYQAQTALREAVDAVPAAGSYREAVRAAARACIRADEAREEALKERSRIHRLADRLFRECRALIEEADSMGLDPNQEQELNSYSARADSVRRLFEEGSVTEAYDGSQSLKNDLLIFLNRLKGHTR